MSLENAMQVALLIVVLVIVLIGLGLALLLESEVLFGAVIMLPFLAALWLVRTYHLHLTRQCLATYLQMCKPLKQ